MTDSDDKRRDADVSPDDEPISAEELARLDRPLQEVFGIKVHFLPEDLAPPVDEQRLVAFVRHELSDDDRVEILDMISSFRSWNDALGVVLRRGVGRRTEG